MADLSFTQSADPVTVVNDSSGNQLAVNTDGSLINSPRDGIRTTYAVAFTNIASAATATDIFTIFGSATKTIRVLLCGISGIQTTAGDISILAIIRSATNTGGTSSSGIKVPYDSTNAAATATVLSYTANPTSLGTAVGTIISDKLFVPPAAANTTAETLVFNFGTRPGQAIVLRGTTQGLCINLNSTTVVGGSFSFWIEWTEE